MQKLKEYIITTFDNFYISKLKPIYEDKITNKNALDKFKKLIDMETYDFDDVEWNKMEKTRVKDKQISTKLGEFWETLLGCYNNWSNCNINKEFER